MTSVCQACGYEIDIGGIPPLSTIKCPNCEAELVIPMIIGHLQLERLLAEITCAAVFTGYDLNAEKDVNVCILKKGITTPQEWHELVTQQAKEISTLSHPNIVPLTGFGFLEGEFAATTPALRGGSLSKYDPNLIGPFKITSIVELLNSVAGAMAEAHRMGVAHHNISPQSIYVDENRHTWVRDFLLGSLRYHYERSLGVTPTVSPYYISPEKAMGDPEDIKGDIFSFGVMFYYLLTGRYPFQDDEEITTIYSRVKSGDPSSSPNPYQLLLNPYQIEYRKPIRPRDLRPKIQTELDELIFRSLAPFADDRPSFDEIHHTLSGILSASQAVEAEARNEGAKMTEIKKKMIGLTDTRSIPIMKNLAVDTVFGLPVLSTKAKMLKKDASK